ncbi:hypothetical protein ABT275_34070 [Streptomyces sp. NPDC001185]
MRHEVLDDVEGLGHHGELGTGDVLRWLENGQGAFTAALHNSGLTRNTK